jgi:hypothetical protein
MIFHKFKNLTNLLVKAKAIIVVVVHSTIFPGKKMGSWEHCPLRTNSVVSGGREKAERWAQALSTLFLLDSKAVLEKEGLTLDHTKINMSLGRNLRAWSVVHI